MDFVNAKNYTEQGGEVTHIGGQLVIDDGGSISGAGVVPNKAASTAATVAALKDDFNALLVLLKDNGLMVPDALTISVSKNVTDSVAANANRSANTADISSVAYADGVITITLSKKVASLKDFDGLNGWGVHKWLGIDVSTNIAAITDLYYNGTKLTSDDVSEATACGLSSGHFVRWVAADLVLAGDETQRSKSTFTLKASGYAQEDVQIAIVEPAS